MYRNSLVLIIMVLSLSFSGSAEDKVTAESLFQGNGGIQQTSQQQDVINRGAAVPVVRHNVSVKPMTNVLEPKSSVPSMVPSSKISSEASGKKDFITEIYDLQNQRRKISLDIYKMRVKMIQDNPDLRVLQRTIIGLHEKMAKQLNSDPKIQNLLSKAQNIDKQMFELIDAQQKEKRN